VYRTNNSPHVSRNIFNNHTNGNGNNNVCFAAGKVILDDGRVVDISNVQPGDIVESSEGHARIRAMVKTPCSQGLEELVELEE